ncbi:MAG: L-ribulose-5-phosphate 3-epimerase [Christensenella sp.]|nr:L-ribulose-5-phosphate 3-epimerase [Christensenella sp.]
MLGNHLLGIYEKALPADLSWKERLTAAKQMGFDFVEISIDEADERLARLNWNHEERKALSEAIEETGVRLNSMCLSAHRRFPFGSKSAATREHARIIAEQAISFAVEFGIRVIQVAGYDVYYEPSDAQTRAYFLEGLRAFSQMADREQVMLAVEIMDTDYISSIGAYQALKAAIPSPWLNVYPDLGNLSAWNKNVLEQLEQARREIVAVHIKETIAPAPGFSGQFKCVPFGTGCVDFSAAFGKLETLGYQGPYLIEMWHQPGEDPNRSISSALEFVQAQYEQGVRA